MKDKLVRQAYAHAAFWRMFIILASYRIPMSVTELKVFPSCYGQPSYYVCPRCKLTMEREYMNFCDRCGQKLDWRKCEFAKIVYSGHGYRNRS